MVASTAETSMILESHLSWQCPNPLPLLRWHYSTSERIRVLRLRKARNLVHPISLSTRLLIILCSPQSRCCCCSRSQGCQEGRQEGCLQEGEEDRCQEGWQEGRQEGRQEGCPQEEVRNQSLTKRVRPIRSPNNIQKPLSLLYLSSSLSLLLPYRFGQVLGTWLGSAGRSVRTD